MPSSAPLSRYTLIAFIIVVVLIALTVANRVTLFQLFDPAGTRERQQEQALLALGSADTGLDSAQAHELFQRYLGGERAAGAALLHQDQKNGLPKDFTDHLEALLSDRSADAPKIIYLVERMALHRVFDVDVERTLVDAARPAGGGTNTQPIRVLGNIGAHRPLTEPTLRLFLEVSLARSPANRVALTALEKTAQAHGLPDWALDRLQTIAETRPGIIRSEAIKVIAAAGERERALAIANAPGNSPANREAITLMFEGADLARLDRILRDSSLRPELRTGALTKIIKRRDQSERVGSALAYAFTSDDAALRLTAFNTFSQWGRHHSRYIAVDWPDVCARAFADDNESIRIQAASNFRFIPFADLDAKDRFLLDMLAGTESQRLAALRAISRSRSVSDTLKPAVGGLAGSGNPEIAQVAGMLKERYRPKGALEGLGRWLAGAALWFLLLLPAVTALGFETYFVARLLQNIASGERLLAPALASIVWFALSIALGLLLFVGVMAAGHGGGSGAEVYLVLLVINAVFAGVAMFLRVFVKKRAKPAQ